MKRFRALVAASVVLTGTTALAAVGPSQLAHAAAADLLISEYVEGASFLKAVEIYNGTGAPVDLSAYSLELYSNGSPTASQSVALTGTLADGDVYVVSHSDAGLAPGVSDLNSNSVANFNGDDGLTLVKGGAIIDSFGQQGLDPGSEWSGGGADDTLVRNPAVCAGDTDFTDPFAISTDQWTVHPANTVEFLGAHTADCGGVVLPLTAGDVADQSFTVGAEITPIVLTASGGTPPYSFAVDALPDGLALTGDTISGIPTTVGTTPVTVTVTDAAPAQATDTFSITVTEPATFPELNITELRYDTAGADVGEAIEVTGPAGTDLTGWSIVLYNGNDNAPYDTDPLGGTLADQGGGFGTTVVSYPSNGIQNGSPDGLALVRPDGSVAEFLSYEGTITGVGGPANGMVSVDIGVAQGGSDSPDLSLQRVETDPPSWRGPVCSSFGFLNDPDAPAACPTAAALSINAFLASTTGSDPEYIELFGDVGHSLSGLSLIVVEGDAGLALGTIEKKFDFAAGSKLGENGFYLVANQLAADTFGVTPNAMIAADFLENSSFTLALVETASVGSEGSLLDPATAEVIDSVGLTDGGPGDTFFLGAPAVGPDGTFLPPGARRVANGIDTDTAADWEFLVFSPADSPVNTPTSGSGDVGGGGDPDPDPAFAKIHEVQGAGDTSPMVGQIVTVEGIVVGDHEGPSGTLRGLLVQEEDSDADADPLTSEGVFVFTGTDGDAGAVGDKVSVTGEVAEFFGSTQISNATVTFVSSDNPLPTPAAVSFPLAGPADLEHVENMLVTLTDTMVISEYFEYGRYGQIVLAKPVDGESRPFIPTALFHEDDPAAAERRDLNLRSRIIVDDGLTSQNPPALTHPINGQRFTIDNSFRGGDTVTGFTGSLVYSFDEFQMITNGTASFTSTAAPAAPDDVGGTLTVAALNALNYFVSLDIADTCGPTVDQDCRGADNQAEFERQRPKLLAAISGTGADVIGLMEIENTPGVEPLADIVAGLNDLEGENAYAYVAAGENAVVGTDAIKVGLIYRPGSVTPVGAPAVLDTPEFLDPLGSGEDKNRAAVAQTFVENATGEVFSVVVNHLKSKGSACPGDAHALAGNCNITRIAAANVLADWIAGDPTGTPDDDWLIIGDLNSYDRESPIVALEAAGYTDLIRAYQGEHAFSYVFDGEFGYLDHILGSSSITPQVTGSTEWHINSTEASVWDYDTQFKPACPDGVEPPCQIDLYQPNAFRSSDHDAALVGLDLSSHTGTHVFVKPKFHHPATGFTHRMLKYRVGAWSWSGPVETTIVDASSSEPDSGLSRKDRPGDIDIVNATTVLLRDEAYDFWNGRTYTVDVEVAGDGQVKLVSVDVQVGGWPFGWGFGGRPGHWFW